MSAKHLDQSLRDNLFLAGLEHPRDSYAPAWEILAAAGVLGAAAIYAVSVPKDKLPAS